MKKLFSKLINVSFDEYKKSLTKAIILEDKKMIVTANTETFVIAIDDQDFSEILFDDKVDLIADGIGLVKMSGRYSNKLKERIPGIEIAEYLLSECNRLNKSVYFYGAEEVVINKLIQVINNKYPNLHILGYKNGYDYNRNEVFKDIVKQKPDLCLIALGVPAQEKLIYKNIQKFKKGIFVGVGGSFDVLSGTKKRAPRIFLKLNLEWLYRIIKEPSRIKRFCMFNIKFVKINLKNKKKEVKR